MGNETVTCCREWMQTTDLYGNPILRHERGDGTGYSIIPLDDGPAHCYWCGARFTLRETGEVQVGPSVAKLLAALALELSDHGDCPMDYSDCPCPAAPETHDCEGGPVELCWLLYYGLAATYADAQALWARMEEAAKCE